MKLFVSDLDGTLVDDKGVMSSTTRELINAAVARGVKFTIATARSVHTLAPMVDGLDLRLPVIEFNGSYMTDLQTRRPHFCRHLDPAAARDVVTWAQEADLGAFLSTWDGDQQHLYPPERIGNAGMEWYMDRRVAAADPRLRQSDTQRALGQRVVCLTLMARRDPLQRVEARILEAWGDRVRTVLFENLYSPGWHWLTVNATEASKAHAIAELARLEGLGMADVTVFGDGLNDVPMFEAAGRGVAVGNALPVLKALASEVIGANTTDSVARYLAERSHPEG